MIFLTILPLVTTFLITLQFFPLTAGSAAVAGNIDNNHLSDSSSVGIPATDFNKSKTLRIAVVGDVDSNQGLTKQLELANQYNVQVFVIPGDFEYTNGKDVLSSLQSHGFSKENTDIVVGNHDSGGDVQSWLASKKTFGEITFGISGDKLALFNIDANINFDCSSPEFEILKSQIQSSKALYKFAVVHENKSINWIIVYTFRSFYSSNTTHPGQEELRDAYHPLFDKYGVDVVLQAHNHNYQRTYPISYNVTTPSSPIITNRNTENYTNIENGQIFITLGTGGAEFYNFTAQAPFIVKQLLLHGFLNMDVANNGSKLWITFYENTCVARDHLTISKIKA